MEFKGTKGKWIYDYEQESILSENGYVIADIFPGGQEANALLISKAPEMLEMLIDAKQVLEDAGFNAEQLIKEATEL